MVIILGHHAVYLRLPSQDPTSKVHRIKVDDLHQDLLAEKDKPLYSKCKLGILEYGPEWEGETAQEVHMISEGLERFAAQRPEAYMEVVSGKIEEQLWSHLPPAPPVHLPGPSGASSDSGDDQVMPPPPIIVPDPQWEWRILMQLLPLHLWKPTLKMPKKPYRCQKTWARILLRKISLWMKKLPHS